MLLILITNITTAFMLKYAVVSDHFRDMSAREAAAILSFSKKSFLRQDLKTATICVNRLALSFGLGQTDNEKARKTPECREFHQSVSKPEG